MYPRLHQTEQEHWYREIWHDGKFWALFALVSLGILLILVAFFTEAGQMAPGPFSPGYFP